MKGKGKHPHNALTSVKVRQIKDPGRYVDGNGLYLIVDPSGAKRWLLRTVIQGRRRDMGLGGAQLVSLAEAREKAHQYRKIARNGGDPIAEGRKSRITLPTFAEAAQAVHAEHLQTWKNKKHGAQWINTLLEYAIPIIGAKRVDDITTPDVLNVLSPIWLAKPETARRVKQRIGTVMDWAKAAGFRAGDNPVDGVTKGLPRQPDRKGHHATLPYGEIPTFVSRLRENDGADISKLAFEFLLLTATRTSEVLGARWDEIDFNGMVWSIPGNRMKMDREHRVPLAPRGVEILRQAKELSEESDLVFPGRSHNRPLSNMVFLMILRRINLDITAHGFRSAFRDWAAECTNFPNDVCEMALAHTIKNKTEAAYRRGDLLERRVPLMEQWATYCEPTPGSNVVPVVSSKAAT